MIKEENKIQTDLNKKIISSYYYLYTSISGFNSINKNEEENYFKNSDKYHQNLYFTNNIDINEINKIYYKEKEKKKEEKNIEQFINNEILNEIKEIILKKENHNYFSKNYYFIFNILLEIIFQFKSNIKNMEENIENIENEKIQLNKIIEENNEIKV